MRSTQARRPAPWGLLRGEPIAQPAKLPNTHARKGTSVRQTDSVHIANVDASFRRSVVPLVGFATPQRGLKAGTLCSTRSLCSDRGKVLGDNEDGWPREGIQSWRPRPACPSSSSCSSEGGADALIDIQRTPWHLLARGGEEALRRLWPPMGSGRGASVGVRGRGCVRGGLRWTDQNEAACCGGPRSNSSELLRFPESVKLHIGLTRQDRWPAAWSCYRSRLLSKFCRSVCRDRSTCRRVLSTEGWDGEFALTMISCSDGVAPLTPPGAPPDARRVPTKYSTSRRLFHSELGET